MLAASIVARAYSDINGDGGGAVSSLYIFVEEDTTLTSSLEEQVRAAIALSWKDGNGKIEGLAVNPPAAVDADDTTTAVAVEQVVRAASDFLVSENTMYCVRSTAFFLETADPAC